MAWWELPILSIFYPLLRFCRSKSTPALTLNLSLSFNSRHFRIDEESSADLFADLCHWNYLINLILKLLCASYTVVHWLLYFKYLDTVQERCYFEKRTRPLFFVWPMKLPCDTIYVVCRRFFADETSINGEKGRPGNLAYTTCTML